MAKDKRRVIELLPVALQTETLTKFFAATLDHLMQPESIEFLSGYIGSKPSYYNPSKDFYVSEPTKPRTDYQLPVTAITMDQTTGQTKNIMFYDDIVNMLGFHGANISNHSRLFDQEYYSWAPPIDIDKLLNYTRYFWVPDGPSTIYLLDQTDAVNDILDNESYVYSGAYILKSTGETKIGNIRFTNGLTITFTNDVTAAYNNVDYQINGVGVGIKLTSYVYEPILPFSISWDMTGWGGQGVDTTKNYITISRYSSDQNQWSVNNRWYHEDVLTISGTVLKDAASAKALRPIIEFSPDILLWDYGWFNRPSVDLVVDNILDVMGELVGKPEYIYEDVPLTDGMRLLILNDSNPYVTDRIFTVGGITENGAISLTLATDGQNQDGSPTVGDRCVVTLGSYQDKNLWFNKDGIWSAGQQFSLLGPVFSMFDSDGNDLSDPSVYPNSDFAGNKIFSYTQDPDSVYDPILDMNPKRDQFGSYVFTNYVNSTSMTYVVNNSRTGYVGYQFYQTRGDTTNYGNGWHRSKTPSRQYLVNDYLSVSVGKIIEPVILDIDQLPAPSVAGQLDTIQVFRIRDQKQVKLLNDQDYKASLNTITNLPQLTIGPGILQDGDRVLIKTWNPKTPIRTRGYYELPLNLTANANNQDITTISQSQLVTHFKQIMENQEGFVGNVLGNNNYRDTAKDLSLGLSILQHRAPMLKLMILNSGDVADGVMSAKSNTDPMLAMQFGQREYIRFYTRFVKGLFTLYDNGFSIENAPEDWINTVLKQLNIGKTQENPWANSGYDLSIGSYCSSQSSNPTFIPPTPARLGVTPSYQPMVYIQGLNLILQTHDGSRLILEDKEGRPLGTILDGASSTMTPRLLSNPIAKAWLQFELNLFYNIPVLYRNNEAQLVFDVRELIPGKWRDTEYSRDEYLDITRSMFDKWVTFNQVDYRPNTTFDVNDQWTFNYRNQLDQQGRAVPGNWRGIYRWFYDTDRPHTHPWEMLGFTQMPDWWANEYGPAPYTNGNTRLWEDLRDGVIKQGPRSGTNTAWARPGLMSCIPVDEQGNLLPPFLAGTVRSLPSIDQARQEWIYGDGSPIESVWVHSQDYGFSLAESGYLMKPARFVEYCWDTPRTKQVYPGTSADQWIYVDTNSRRSNSQFYVHRENPIEVGSSIYVPNESNLSYFGSCGIQHWISEYLISQSLSVTNYFGSTIRGSCAKLAHKVGAYINSNDNSLRFTADSFGTLGYRSQLVPSENINTYLYRSASIGTSFYGGVIVKQIRNGWQIFGYDGVNPVFNVIPSNITGPKTNQVIGNQRMVLYSTGLTKNGEPVVDEIPYGTVFGTRQEVYDFLVSYGRWLENEGWVFDTYNDQNNTVTDWIQSAREFVYWSQANWANGNFIAISPLANSAKFAREFGNIEFVSGLISGTYPVLDRSGSPIDSQNLEILRYDDQIVVRSLNEQSIYGLRLFRTTIEHVVVFDNITSFGDTIYDPLFDVLQPRLKIYAYRTNNWTGRLDAPGYFLYQNSTDNTWTMIPNFEKTSDDIRKYFNIEQPKNFDEVNPATNLTVMNTSQNSVIDRSDIADLSKHLFGYQKRNYLNNLLLEDSTEFQFYQGFIRQKGTNTTIDKILRNTSIVDVNEGFEYYEEFALRSGRYGSSALNINIEFILPQTQFVNSPQQINVFGRMTSNREIDGIIEFIPNDPRFLTPPTNWTDDRFPLRNSLGPYDSDLPTAGYVKLGETDWYVTNSAALTSLYSVQVDTNDPLEDRDTIWQFVDQYDGWTVWQYTKSPSVVINTTPTDVSGLPTTINCDGPHGLVNGDLVTLVGIANVDVLNGTWTVQNVNSFGNTFQVPQNTFSVGNGGNIYAYRRVRFGNVQLRDDNPPVGGWEDGDIAWVDSGDVNINGWTVYKLTENQWLPTRTENRKVDASLMIDSNLYNMSTDSMLTNIVYYDPAKGYIPGMADKNLDIKSIYDPARYDSGDEELYQIVEDAAWGLPQVGFTWWDLSTVRYIDYEISEDSYRWKNWGKIAPGTTVDIYEWVRSPVPPSNWDSYVAQGQSFSQFGIDYAPSGTVRNKDNPAWCESVEYDANGIGKTWYYFWVTNATTLPMPQGRTLTTLEVSNIINNPNAYGVIWYAAMSKDSILVANVSELLDNDSTVMQMTYTNKKNDGIDHKQWELVREGDRYSTVSSYFWNKMHDSLIGYDAMGNDVPDMNLNETQRYGTLIRPRQSWFRDRREAAKIYVNKVNSLLASSSVPLRDDPDAVGWTSYFTDEEPIPPQEGNWDYIVSSLSERDSISDRLENGQKVLVTATADTDYLWTIYQWNYFTRSYTRVRVQEWKTQNYWDYVDWYSSTSGVNASTIPDLTVGTIAGLENVTPIDSTVVKVLNNGKNLWELYQYIDSQWERVALESGTIQIRSSIYDGSDNVVLFDEDGFDSSTFDMNPFTEFSNIINGVRYDIFGSNTSSDTIEMNSIFFSMINYVLCEQGFVDWIIKTSHIILRGFNQALYTGDLYQSDNIDNLLAYIDEVRPYHSKVREFISGRTTFDNTMIDVTDFDKPVYNGRVLLPSNRDDAAILASDPILKRWYENYARYPNLIRQLKATLVFDRVTSYKKTGWNSSPWSGEPWSYDVGTTSGAFYRIKKYYKPTEDMIPIESDALISGSAYKGSILRGMGFNISTGWDMSAWDSAIGWNATEMDFDNYLDIVIQGGAIPQYESFYGDNRKVSFRLSKVPQDVSHSAVWSDNVLRTYGVDWIIPNWFTDASIVDGGSGYQVGEILIADIPNAVNDARFVVSLVDQNGSILEISLDRRGNYDLVYHAPVSLVYRKYHEGTGSGAKIQPVWGGDTLVFNQAPGFAEAPNIHILYAGETFDPAPDSMYDTIFDGYQLSQPYIEQDHAEERYTTRLKDSIRLDVYSQPVGGKPVIYVRNYETDGITDQFDLNIKPQNEYSVIASLNGTVLRYGINNDYVINFYTNKLVFMLPPPAGSLRVTTIGTGGSGTGIIYASVVEPGSGYNTGDIVTLSGGVGNDAKIMVVSTKAVAVSIINGGTGYMVGDTIMMLDDPTIVCSVKLKLVVSSVDDITGAVTGISISEHGDYKYRPATPSWMTNGSGIGVDLNLSWGASDVEVYSNGFYFVKPTEPFTQKSVSPLGGTGIQINASYSISKGTDVFTVPASPTIFNLSFDVDGADQLLVTLNGSVLGISDYIVSNRQLNILIPLTENDTVVATGFNTSNFSVVSEQQITIASGQYIYNLDRPERSERPNYAGAMVMRNNKVMRPPPMNSYIGDGIQTNFAASYVPPFGIGLSVYVDNVELINGSDYTISGTTVTLSTPPRNGGYVVIIVIDSSYGYDYIFSNNSIEFLSSLPTAWTGGTTPSYGTVGPGDLVVPGDTIRVLTFTEDYSYKWLTEMFVSAGNTDYQLQTSNFDKGSLMVFLDGDTMSLFEDYLIVDSNGVSAIRFVSAPSVDSCIVVSYATGLSDSPPIAWRTLINDSGQSNSVAIDDERKTTILSNVYVYSNEITIADITKISPPTETSSGAVWIGNELVTFDKIEQSPTVQHPNRGIISNLKRGWGTTSYSPTAGYNVLYYFGDGATRYFAAPSGTIPIEESIFVDDEIQIDKAVDPNVGTYEIVLNPSGLPAGRYVVFDLDSIPRIGWKNVKISYMYRDASNTRPIHSTNSEVIDAGAYVQIPGGYSWEPNPNGLQNSLSSLSAFLKSHQGTRS